MSTSDTKNTHSSADKARSAFDIGADSVSDGPTSSEKSIKQTP